MTLASITQGQGRPLVLLHGWGMNAGVWLPLLPRLEAHWRVTMIELPGHGESHLIEGDIHDWAGAVLDTAPSNAIWLGWSLGAMVALALARRAGVSPFGAAGSPAAQRDVRTGDIITAVNRSRIRTVQELATIAENNRILFLLVQRGERSLMLQIR